MECRKNLCKYVFWYVRKSTAKRISHRFFHRISAASTLKGFAIRCNCLYPFQPFLSLDKRFENYRFSCFQQLKSPKRKGTNNHVETIVPFAQVRTTSVASYFQLDREIRNIPLHCLIFAVDREPVVGERQLSFVDRSGDLILLSMSRNVQNIVDHGSRKDSDLLEETGMWISLTYDRRDCRGHCRRWTCKSEGFMRGEREVNFIYFRRWDCPNHSWRLIYKRQRFLWEQRQMNFTHFDQWVWLDCCRRLI